jgi:hypothetical protein
MIHLAVLPAKSSNSKAVGTGKGNEEFFLMKYSYFEGFLHDVKSNDMD